MDNEEIPNTSPNIPTQGQGMEPWSPPEDSLTINPTTTPDSVNNFLNEQGQGISFNLDNIYDSTPVYDSTPDTEVKVEIRYIYSDRQLEDIISNVGGDVVTWELKYDRHGQPNGNATITYSNHRNATHALNSRIWEENDLDIKSTQLGQQRWPRNDTRLSPVGSLDTAEDEEQQSTDPPLTTQPHTQLGRRGDHIHLTTPTILEQTESNTTNTTTATANTRTPREPTATPYTPHHPT
jgi:hypothetical protein